MWKICKRTVLLTMLLILFSSLAFAFPDSSTKMIETYTYSLGTPSVCKPMECNVATLLFYLPADIESETINLRIRPECFAYSFNSTEIWNITVFCIDGTSTEYDMKDAFCDISKDLNLVINLTNSGGYSFFGETQLIQSWCAFRANDHNTEGLPAEFRVTVDGVILHSKYVYNTTLESYESQEDVSLSMDTLIDLDMTVWNIGYSMFVLFAILFGIGFILSFVPIALKYVIKKVTEE